MSIRPAIVLAALALLAGAPSVADAGCTAQTLGRATFYNWSDGTSGT